MSSSALVSPFYDVGDVLRQNVKMNQMKSQLPTERRNTIGAPMNVQRNRNFSIGNFTAVSGNTPAPCVISMDNQIVPTMANDHRKLDRSYSEPCDRLSNNNTNLNVALSQAQQNKAPVNSSRYKTELCRPFEESGHCKYADKCQFAHGFHELKNLQRHPKYKTELCRTFHTKGFCPYGPRCNFVHNEALQQLNMKNNRLSAAQSMPQQQQQQQQQQPQPTQYFQHISPPMLSQSPPPAVQRPMSINFNCSFNGSMGSTADSSPPSSVGSESPSLSPVFFGEDINMNSCYSLPGNNMLNYDNSTNNSVFTNLSELASMDLPPLNIQTHMNDSDFGLIQQFNELLNLNNRSNNKTSAFEEWDCSHVAAAGAAPLSSPDSISGESIGSSTSCSSSGSFSSSLCGSPSDAGRSVRLPVFNHISQE